MKKQLSCIGLAIAFGISPHFAYAQNQSYLTDEELQKLMPDFQRQVQYWSQYEEPERQSEARAFGATLSRDRAVTPFLGKWAAIEETMDIYPSKINGQVCIIHAFSTPEPEVDFSLGKVLNQRIYPVEGGVIIQQGNYVGVAGRNGNEAGIYVYRLIEPAEAPTRAYWRDWDEGDRVIEQFKAAGCIKANSQESRSCVTWEQGKSEVQSLYSGNFGYSHPLPELPDGFKNGCVFGDSGAYTIAISVLKDELRPRITQDYDTLLGTSIPKFSAIVDGESETDETWDSLRFYNVCSSTGTLSFCEDIPTDAVYIKDGLVCLNNLCIEADSVYHTELVRLWNEALEQRQRAVLLYLPTRNGSTKNLKPM